jgi:ribosomal protein S18 acetylase RimI-like enzyme
MSNKMIDIAHLQTATEAQRTSIVAPLEAYSRDQGFFWSPTHVALALQDGPAIQGGLLGFIQWDWFHIETLGVAASLRGQGWGRKLIEAAQDIACKEECQGMWVSTFTFQAPGFYEQLGFEKCGEITDHPIGQSRLFYMRRLEHSHAA